MSAEAHTMKRRKARESVVSRNRQQHFERQYAEFKRQQDRRLFEVVMRTQDRFFDLQCEAIAERDRRTDNVRHILIVVGNVVAITSAVVWMLIA